MTKPNALSLFSGCGGLDLGFHSADYDVIAAIDNWQDALNTIKFNNNKTQTLNLDLSTKIFELPKHLISNVDVVFGGPPCQGFSISGKREVDDPRNNLYLGFLNVVKIVNPKVFLMENVANLVSMAGGKIFEKIVGDFEKLGYRVNFKILLASDFGVPQNRKRVFIIGIKQENYKFPLPNYNLVTCADAISDLPENSLDDGSMYLLQPQSEYQKEARENSSGVFNHQITKHSEQTIDIISKVPDGGNYKNLPIEYQNIRNVNIAWTRYSSKKPSFTIDTGHRHHFHYMFNRVPTVRESARLQSFPDSYFFTGTKTSQYKQVGNAVPPLLAKILAKSIRKYL